MVNDRRASLDDEEDIRKPMLKLVREEFKRGATLPVVDFPADGAAVGDSPRLTLVVLDPDTDWNHKNALERNLSEWTKKRGDADRLYPGALVWCVKKPGRALRDKIELWQAWKRVQHEIDTGVLGGEFEAADRAKVRDKVTDAAEDARDSVWADYIPLTVSLAFMVKKASRANLPHWRSISCFDPSTNRYAAVVECG